jgi:hypothetical protein
VKKRDNSLNLFVNLIFFIQTIHKPQTPSSLMSKPASWWGQPTPDATKVFQVRYFADAGGSLVLETLDSREEADERLKQYLANPKEELGKSPFFKGKDGKPSYRDLEKESCKPEKFQVSESWSQVYK